MKRRNRISLKTLKRIIDRCAKKTDGSSFCKVEIWLDNEEYRIKEIGQFGVIPDVVIQIEGVKE